MITLPLIFPVSCHTDTVGNGSTFVAINGTNYHGADFIPQAIAKGATTIVIEKNQTIPHMVQQLITRNRVAVLRVDKARKALAQLSAQAAGYPANKLKIIGITGTKGKTTSAFLLYHLLSSAGLSTALLSTVKNSINGTDFPAPLTTPQPDYLHQFLLRAVEHGVTHLVMEVAAQAVSLHRLETILFDALLFTNFSREHLEFYSSMEQYLADKLALINSVVPGAPVVINGDERGFDSLRQCPTHMTFGEGSAYDWGITLDEEKLLLKGRLKEATGQELPFICPQLIGSFNGLNVAGAYAVARRIGIASSHCIEALQSFTAVPGRLEQCSLPNGAIAYIDHAHNPDSYQRLLSLLKAKTDKLIVLFGCGGGRDAGKRPLMGAVADQYADLIVLTTDNPRYEDPDRIVQDILLGIRQREKTTVILDRATAIRFAYEQSQAGSIIAILGKGAEGYQLIGDQKIPHLDAGVVQELCSSSV